jgi:hypothetical protein
VLGLNLMCRLPKRGNDFLAVTGVFRRKNVCAIPSVGTVSLTFNLFGRDRGHLVTCNRLFRVAMRLRGSRPPTNCTWVSFRYRKGSEDYTSVCGVICAELAPTCGGVRADCDVKTPHFSLGKSPACARLEWNKLLIWLQSALIPFIGNFGRSTVDA